jgi:hypothetical protein
MPSVIKSFRLDQKLAQKLARMAKKYGQTESQLVSSWLASRASFDPLVPTFDVVSLGKDTFRSILGTADVDALEIVAWEFGKEHVAQAKALFESTDQQMTLVVYLTQILGEHAHWFRIEGETAEERKEITLHHDMTIRWSGFLKSYVSGAYAAISGDKLMFDLGDHFVRVKFPRAGESGAEAFQSRWSSP